MPNQLLALFFISMLASFSSFAQDWSQVAFSMTSEIGNNTCHPKGRDYNFNFNVTIPHGTENTQGDDVYKETYALVNVGSFGTTVHGDPARIYTGVGQRTEGFRDFGTASSGQFRATYNSSQSNAIEFNITINIRYVRTHTYTDVDGNQVTDVLEDFVEDHISQNFIFNGPPNFENNPILVDGLAKTALKISSINPCQTYTLTASTINATRYQWHLPDPSWLVSSSTSLTSASIDISADWSKVDPTMIQEIRLEALQDCHTSVMHKDRILFVERVDPKIEGHSICFNGGPTTLSVPAAGQGTLLNWTIDPTKLNFISGQGSNSIEVQANNYHRAYTPIILDVTTPCGDAQIVQNHWMGAPLPQVSALTGVSTAQPSNVRTFEGSPADGTVTNYTWSIPSSGLQFPYCTDCWKLRGSGTTTNNNNEEEPFAHVQIGRNSGYVQALYENACGNSAAIKYVNVQQGGPGGGGLCCDAPDPKTLDPNPMVTISLDGQRTSYGFDIEPEVLDITALDAEEGRIYPNPAVDMIHIEIATKDWTEKGAEIVLYNLVSGKSIQVIATVQNTSLDVSELPSGVYVVDVITERKNLTEKIVIKH